MNSSFHEKRHIPVELLADYEQGLVDHATRQELKEHLHSCEQCSITLEGIRHYLETYGAEALEAYLEHSGESTMNGREAGEEVRELASPDQQPRKGHGHTWWKIAAVIIILLLPSLLLWKHISRPSAETLVAQHMEEPFPWGSIGRGNASALEGDVEQARFAYRSGNYEMALSLIDQRIFAGESTLDDRFYRGLCYLYMSPPNLSEAISSFDEVISEGQRFREQAEWYRALALIKAGSDIEAGEALKAIAQDQQHYMAEKARELLATYPNK